MTARAAWAAAALGAAAVALGGWGARAWLRPRPTLGPALALADAGRPDDAEGVALAYLRAYPDDPTGLILLARIEVDRMDRLNPPDLPLARATLARVRRARAGDPRLAALGRFYEGVLCERLMRLDEAEAAWRDAFRLYPGHAEPARRLLAIYDLQGRKPEARELALRLYRAEKDGRARLETLLGLVRTEVYQPAAVEVIDKLTPVVRENPGDLRSALALGRALVREGRPAEGLKRLRAAVRDHPDDRDARDALLTALEDAGRVEAVEQVLRGLRPGQDGGAPDARHAGWVEQERGRWKDAARSYRLALETTPDDARLRYRLSRMLRLGGDEDGATRLERENRDRAEAARALRSLYERAPATLTDGTPHPDLYREFSDLLATMGRADEARAWRSLGSRAAPGGGRDPAATGLRKGP